jgi:hypothetical protein
MPALPSRRRCRCWASMKPIRSSRRLLRYALAYFTRRATQRNHALVSGLFSDLVIGMIGAGEQGGFLDRVVCVFPNGRTRLPDSADH